MQKLVLTAVCLMACASILAQPAISFTQITTGPLVEDQSGGMAITLVDVNGDGLLDIYIGRAEVPGSGPVGSGTRFNRLLRNNGDGTFTSMTNNLIRTPASMFGSWGDYDNDGLPDLFSFLTKYLNLGNWEFSAQTMISSGTIADAIWVDYNRDGRLDLFVMTSQADLLYRNDGANGFTQMSADQVGSILADANNGWYCRWLDVNKDGWPDLYRNINTGSAHYHEIHTNNGQGFFYAMEIGSMTNGAPLSSMLMWEDYDNDGYPDAWMFNYQSGGKLFRNLQGLGFTNVTAGSGLPTEVGAFIATWGDFDNDGWPDVYLGNGVSTQPGWLYRNNGDGTFTKTSVSLPGNPNAPYNGAGHTRCGDYDNDGFLDVVIAFSPQTPCGLFRNDANNGNRWLKVKLNGTASNRQAIGAKVRARATINGRTFWQHQEISAAQVFFNTPHSCGLAHFGLGNATNLEVLRIEWPSGIVQEMASVTANQFLTVSETVGITAQSADQLVLVGGAVTNSVQAVGGNPPLDYQWYFNGVAIPGAIWPTLVLTNVQQDQTGTYYCIVHDDESRYATSQVATLTVVANPTIVLQPLSQSGVVGELVTLSVAVTNNATLPIEYRWRKDATDFLTNTLDRYEDFLTVPVGPQASNYSVVVANLAQPGGYTSALATVSPLADLDGDQIPDEWETAMGTSTNTPNHHLADDDSDGVSNGQEYRAGTCPTNHLSCLKVSADPQADGHVLRFQAMSNKTYTVQYANQIITIELTNRSVWVTNAWSKLVDIPAAPTNRSLEIRDPGTISNRFYKIVTPRAP